MLLFAQLAILLVLVIMDVWLGIFNNAYNTIWWWDIPSHFLGGVWAGLFIAWILQIFCGRFTIWQCILGTFAIGVSWEIFEYLTGIGASQFISYPVDTTKDLIVDVLGGALAGSLALIQKPLWRRR